MKPIYNRLLPTKGFKAINLCGLIFVRKGLTFGIIDANHEGIHTKQMLEMLILPFYLFYLIEWLIKLVYYRNSYKAYRNLSFEREAYANEHNLYYLENRKHYCWWKYIRHKPTYESTDHYA